jgi:leucyl aminopeptidase
VALGCGGLLGVNRGSTEPPRMIKMTYTPADNATRQKAGRLAFVGKGLTYDSGGISLKPSNPVHATMKNDMSGGGAVVAAMSAVRDLRCPNRVTAWVMCTDNMPDGSAMALGDVLTIYGGKTVEVMNTDAEGRLIMADALELAVEEKVDAIVDIATLTGACLMALGPLTAGVFGNDQALVDQVLDAAKATDESAWQLPLDRRYRPWLDSEVADLKNLGGDSAGATIGALFLEEFVADVPWAHLDIAGTAQVNTPDSWRTAGGSGYGARLLAELAVSFLVTGDGE